MPNKETNKWNKVMDKIVNKHKILKNPNRKAGTNRKLIIMDINSRIPAFDIILKLLSDSYFFLF